MTNRICTCSCGKQYSTIAAVEACEVMNHGREDWATEIANKIWHETHLGINLSQSVNAIARELRKVKKDTIEKFRKELVLLCEDTEEKCHALAGKGDSTRAAWARGRILEAKAIRRTMYEYAREELNK